MAKPFTRVADAARALLTVTTLSEREGQFCGGLSYRSAPLTEKQTRWLQILLSRHHLPPLRDGAVALGGRDG